MAAALIFAAAAVINAAALFAMMYATAFGDDDPKWQNKGTAVAGALGLFAIILARFG